MPRKRSTKEDRPEFTEEDRAEFRKRMSEMTAFRLEMFAANVDKTAEVLGAYRKALERSGFSAEESMQIILKSVEQTSRRPMFPWWHWGHGKQKR